jgi:signal transduction histidine kinase
MPARLAALVRLGATSVARLAAATTVAVGVVAAGIGWLAHWQLGAELSRHAAALVAADLEAFAEPLRQGGAGALAHAVRARSSQPGSGLYLLTDENGRPLAGNMAGALAHRPIADGGDLVRYAPAPTEPRESAAQAMDVERSAFVVALSMPDGGRLMVGRDVEEQRRFLAAARTALVAAIVAMGALTLGIGLVAGRRLLVRIDTITRTSRAIMAGDLSRRIALDGSGDEMDRLSQSLNDMLARIEHLVAGFREVSDNIAHDLKTPLARLRNRAEAALREPAGAGGDREALRSVIESADELITTFNALLSIARLEAGTAAGAFAAIDLAAIVSDVVELYDPVAEEAGLAIAPVIGVETPVFIEAHRELVGQAVANLVDNAIKYGSVDGVRPGGAITVAVESDAATARVVVADRGPGIPAGDRERVLARFVRLEASRSRPGTGLGLSLVAAVVRLHGGRLHLEDNDPGLRVVLELPRRPDAAVKSAV